MTFAQFTVWSLDVLGNAQDGFDVNDRSKRGTIDIDPDGDDAIIVGALIEAGYLAPAAKGRVVVDGDDCIISVDDRDGRPLLSLERFE